MSSPFSNIANFRDVALSTSTPTTPSPITPGLLFRSAAPDNATPSDRTLLQQTHHIKTIIDLRTASEISIKAQRSHFQPASVPSLELDQDAVDSPEIRPSSNTPTSQKLPAIKNININLNGSSYSSAMMSRLSYWHRAKLIALYITGYRKEAIGIIGQHVMSVRGLIGLAIDSLTYSRAEIKEIFDLLGEEESYPVLIHCTQGKDRTGLIVILVLLLMGVEEETVKGDYMASAEGLAGDLEERVKAVGEIGLGREFAGCEEGLVGEVGRWLREEYGGVEGYLEKGCGVEGDVVERVKRILKGEAKY